MKNKKFQPIVMPCTKEQYKELIPVLIENNIRVCNQIYMLNFLTITNNHNGIREFVSWNIHDINSNIHSANKRKVYKRFNRKIFLASLGIVEEKPFVLPNKWCIERTIETDKIITDYFSKLHGFEYTYHNKAKYLYTNIITNQGFSTFSRPNGYTEITTEQFKKYVLKQEDILESKKTTNKQSKMKSRIQKKNPPAHVYQKGDLINFGNDVVAIVTKTVKHDFNATVLFSRNVAFKPGDIIHTTQGSDKLSVFIGEVILEQ